MTYLSYYMFPVHLSLYFCRVHDVILIPKSFFKALRTVEMYNFREPKFFSSEINASYVYTGVWIVHSPFHVDIQRRPVVQIYR